MGRVYAGSVVHAGGRWHAESMTDQPRSRGRSPDGERLRLMDLLAALSVTTDLGMGQPAETALRSCLLATGLAREMGLAEDVVRDTCFATLLRHIGCTATAALESRLYGGDELVSRRSAQIADFGDSREMLTLVLSTGTGTGVRRPWLIAGAMLGERRHGQEILASVCDAASMLADRLDLGKGVSQSLAQQFERWDGKGPLGLARDEISLPTRVGEVGIQAALFLSAGGPDAADAMVERRAGSWFDPEVADAFRRAGPALMAELDATDPWQAILAVEPEPVAFVAATELDRVARCFADMVDLKSPYTLEHSSQVADLAEAAGRRLGIGEPELATLRRAALLHDLGRVGVSSGVWEKTGPLSRHEREQIRMHPYHTERILAASTVLEPSGRIAGMHHERLDGSGYHHGLTASAIPLAARVLAAADRFQAATQDRPHRRAVTPEQAAQLLTAEAGAGRLDADCVAAVIDAAGQSGPRMRREWPAALSDREVEVLRLMSRGLGNAEIAQQLVISRRTAEHHVQHIYAKIGHSTRAAAALFAMEHDLLSR